MRMSTSTSTTTRRRLSTPSRALQTLVSPQVGLDQVSSQNQTKENIFHCTSYFFKPFCAMSSFGWHVLGAKLFSVTPFQALESRSWTCWRGRDNSIKWGLLRHDQRRTRLGGGCKAWRPRGEGRPLPPQKQFWAKFRTSLGRGVVSRPFRQMIQRVGRR